MVAMKGGVRGRGSGNVRREVQSKVQKETHSFLFWPPGRTVDISPGDCQDRTDLYHRTSFSFCFTINFQAGQRPLTVTSYQFTSEPACFQLKGSLGLLLPGDLGGACSLALCPVEALCLENAAIS